MHDADHPGRERDSQAPHHEDEQVQDGASDVAEPGSVAPASAASEDDVIEGKNDPGAGAESDAASALGAALASLRTQADALDAMPLDERKVAAAEQVANAAAELDEQIGSIARSDDH